MVSRSRVTSADWSRPEIFCCVFSGRRSRSLMLLVGQTRVSEQNRSRSSCRSRRHSSNDRPGSCLAFAPGTDGTWDRPTRTAWRNWLTSGPVTLAGTRAWPLSRAWCQPPDQRTQRAGRLLGPVLAGVDLSGVLQVAKDVRAADLVTADAGEGPVVVDAVAVVHRHPGETGQHPELVEAAQVPATQEEQCAQLGRGRQHVLLPAGRAAPQRGLVEPGHRRPRHQRLDQGHDLAERVGAARRMPCTKPVEGRAPVRSAISIAARCTGTCRASATPAGGVVVVTQPHRHCFLYSMYSVTRTVTGGTSNTWRELTPGVR